MPGRKDKEKSEHVATAEALSKVTQLLNDQFEKNREEFKAFGASKAETQTKLDELFEKQQEILAKVKLQEDVIAELENSKNAGGKPVREKPETQGSVFCKSEGYLALKATPGRKNSIDCVKVPNIKGYGDDVIATNGNAAGLSHTFVAPGIREINRKQGYQFRNIFPVVSLTEGESVTIQQEQAEYMLICTLTTALVLNAVPGPRTIVVDRSAGLREDAPHNKIKVDDGAGTTQDFVIDTITPLDAANPSGPATVLTTSTDNLAAFPAGSRITADTFAPTLEAQLAPKSSDVFKDVTSMVETISTWISVTKKTLSNTELTENIIDRRLHSKLGRMEDFRVLYASGVSPEMPGLFTTDLIQEFIWSASDVGTSKADFLFKLVASVVNSGHHMATDIFMNPKDYYDIILTKDTTKKYIFWQVTTDMGLTVVMGARINLMTALEVGDLICGDFPNSATLWLDQEAEISFGKPDDHFQRHMTAIMIDERMTLTIDYPQGFARGKYDAAPT